MRAVLGCRKSFSRDIVDFVLTVFHSGHVISERYVLFLAVVQRRGEANQLCYSRLIGLIFAHAFFKYPAKFLPEFRELIFLAFG